MRVLIYRLFFFFFSLSVIGSDKDIPDMNEDYQGWLQAKKKKWRWQRQILKRLKAVSAGDFDAGNMNNMNNHNDDDFNNNNVKMNGLVAGDFFRQAATALLHLPWEIVQITPPLASEPPGHFKRLIPNRADVSVVLM